MEGGQNRVDTRLLFGRNLVRDVPNLHNLTYLVRQKHNLADWIFFCHNLARELVQLGHRISELFGESAQEVKKSKGFPC